MPSSMTAFAREEQQLPWGLLIAEVRSVNHRFLELGFKMSDALRGLEPQVREQLRARLGRGKVEVVLALREEASAGRLPPLDTTLARELLARVSELEQLSVPLAPVDPLALLHWPGLLRTEAAPTEALQCAALQLFERALDAHLDHRAREGAALDEHIKSRLQGIADQVQSLKHHLPQIAEDQQQKLETKLAQLAVEVDRDRLAQEVVYYAQRADVEEELDRLDTHIQEVRRALGQTGPVGRRLDFLMQELNREANTLGSKAASLHMTQAAVEIKVLIEQMREQIQNIE